MVVCKHMYFFGLILCPSTLCCSPQPNACSLKVERLFCIKLEKPVCVSYLVRKPSYTRSCLPKPQSQSSVNGSDGADIPGLVAGWGKRFSAFGFRLFQPYSLWFLAETQTGASAVRRKKEKKKKSSSCWSERFPCLTSSLTQMRVGKGALPSQHPSPPPRKCGLSCIRCHNKIRFDSWCYPLLLFRFY